MIFYNSLFAEYKREVADLELAFDGVTYVQLKGFGDLRTQLFISLRFVHFVDERLATECVPKLSINGQKLEIMKPEVPLGRSKPDGWRR